MGFFSCLNIFQYAHLYAVTFTDKHHFSNKFLFRVYYRLNALFHSWILYFICLYKEPLYVIWLNPTKHLFLTTNRAHLDISNLIFDIHLNKHIFTCHINPRKDSYNLEGGNVMFWHVNKIQSYHSGLNLYKWVWIRIEPDNYHCPKQPSFTFISTVDY